MKFYDPEYPFHPDGECDICNEPCGIVYQCGICGRMICSECICQNINDDNIDSCPECPGAYCKWIW